MALLDTLSNTVDTHDGKEQVSILGAEDVQVDLKSTIGSFKVIEILDSKILEGVQQYLCKYEGSSPVENSWRRIDELNCTTLIDDYNEKHNLKATNITPDSPPKNSQLETVKEALRSLGGRAFGGAIVDWICDYAKDMLHTYRDDRKKLRYCVNGLLSARVNSSIFEKKIYKENGTSRTEWLLSDYHMKAPSDYNKNITTKIPVVVVDKEPKPTEKDAKDADSNVASAEDSENSVDEDSSDKATKSNQDGDDNNSINITTRSSARAAKLRESIVMAAQPIIEQNPYSKTFNKKTFRDNKKGTVNRIQHTEQDKDELIEQSLSNRGMDMMSDTMNIDTDEVLLSADGVGGTQLTYRGMIRTALESMHGQQGTFESISKFIGSRFKDHLTSKAETWKHSIAGCLSVYFTRKEQKDASGKVVWTLEEPLKQKRRGRKRDRDEEATPEKSYRMEYATTAKQRSLALPSVNNHILPPIPKRRKEDMILVSPDRLESLEEENESLKLLFAKRQREINMSDFHVSEWTANNNSPSTIKRLTGNKTQHLHNASNTSVTACTSCDDRFELTMMVNPCGHIFCGSIFCEQSTAEQCSICSATITGRISLRNSRSVQSPNASSATKKTPHQKITKEIRSSSELISPTTSSSLIADTNASSSRPTRLPRSSTAPCLTSLSSLASMIGDTKNDPFLNGMSESLDMMI